MTRLNVGSGAAPTNGWNNYDNSWCVRLTEMPGFVFLLGKLGILAKNQQNFISVARQSKIRWADVTRRIPDPDDSVEVLYSSHMLEHLNSYRAMRFLKEARRVLIPGGIIRIAVPNILYHVDAYLQHKDADRFIRATCLSVSCHETAGTLWERLKLVCIGARHHMWMYDGDSLCKLLSSAGFQNLQVLEPGATTIREPGHLNLREREPESVFVEGVNP